jgi:hypothetical protein
LIVTVPTTSNPETTAPGVEIVNDPEDFNATPDGTPVFDASGNPHDDGAARHPRAEPDPADTGGGALDTDGAGDGVCDTDGADDPAVA